jgi:hypothetical protein
MIEEHHANNRRTSVLGALPQAKHHAVREISERNKRRRLMRNPRKAAALRQALYLEEWRNMSPVDGNT